MDTADLSDGLTDSERGHQEDVRRAVEIGRVNHLRHPGMTTPQILKMYRIRAWRHQYQERHVQHLIKLVYGFE